MYIIMHKEKASIYRLSRGKVTKKNTKFAITDMREKLAFFFLFYDMGVDFSSRNNFANSGSFANVSVSVGSIIPYIKLP